MENIMRERIKIIKKGIRRSRYGALIVVLFLTVLIGFFAVRGFVGSSSSSSALASDKRVNVEKPKADKVINKVILFPVKDQDGREVTKVRYEILTAELRDEIVVKGQKATAVKGRTFLVFNIKITNDYDKPMQINAKDYIRLIINNSKEKLAPEIHNDPVEVQAISTKYTRVGFAINDNVKNLVLQVGEIGEKKEDIKLKF
jgi:hypothetical protein